MAANTIDVLDAAGKKAGTVELPAELFDVDMNVPLVHQVVVAQQAAARQDTRETAQQQRRTPYTAEKMPRPNDPCPCGSGKKFKNCHGRNLR